LNLQSKDWYTSLAKKATVIEFDSMPDPSQDFRYREVNEKLIAYTTQLTRSSFEMGEFIYFLKNFMDLSKCLFYENFTVGRYSSSHIELHHFPLKLHDISETIINKRITESNDDSWSPFEAAEEIVELHFQFMIGLVPLSPTVHELVHADVVPLHLEHVPERFNWKLFVQTYGKWISDDVHGRLLDIEKYSSEHNKNEFPNTLKKNPIHIKVEGQTLLTENKIKQIVVNDRLKEVKELL